MLTFARLLTVFVLALGVSAGCASRKPLASVPPATEELPNVPMHERTIAPSVGVEGGAPPPTVVLTVPPKAPQPTPEEKAKLGPEPHKFNFLEFYQPTPAEQRVSPDLGGATTARHGVGGPAVSTTTYQPLWFVYSGMGGPATGTYPIPVVIWGIYAPREPGGAVGPASPVDVGTGPPSHISKRAPRTQEK